MDNHHSVMSDSHSDHDSDLMDDSIFAVYVLAAIFLFLLLALLSWCLASKRTRQWVCAPRHRGKEEEEEQAGETWDKAIQAAPERERKAVQQRKTKKGGNGKKRKESLPTAGLTR